MTSLLIWYALGWASYGLRARYALYQGHIGLAGFLRHFVYGPFGLVFWAGYCWEQEFGAGKTK